jgi:hypothetical protein
VRRLLLLILFLVACQPAPQPQPSPSPDTRCQSFAHVYNPQRLQVLAPCVHVRGVVEVVRSEADGDYHVLIKPDSGQPDPNGGDWVNACNATCDNGAEHGDLVTEPVCEHTVIQPDAIAACQGYVNPAVVPSVGQHVEVSGPWVKDLTHGWLEVHPATYQVMP